MNMEHGIGGFSLAEMACPVVSPENFKTPLLPSNILVFAVPVLLHVSIKHVRTTALLVKAELLPCFTRASSDLPSALLEPSVAGHPPGSAFGHLGLTEWLAGSSATAVQVCLTPGPLPGFRVVSSEDVARRLGKPSETKGKKIPLRLEISMRRRMPLSRPLSGKAEVARPFRNLHPHLFPIRHL
jgi:hypothetical protein